MDRNKLIAAVIILGALASVWFLRSKNSNMNSDANPPPPPPLNLAGPPPPAISGRPQVEIETSKGKLVLELRPDLAPKTVINFLSKWNSGYCDGKTFHRVEDWVVQGCDPSGDGTGGQTTLPSEFSPEPFTAGSLGVARKSTPRELSNDSQFFIVKTDSLFLNSEYTYFGKVLSGMDVVNKLSPGDKIVSSSILSK